MKKLFNSINGIVLLGLLIAGAQQGNAQPTLQIGDPAPAIQVKKWFKGGPVSGFEKGKVYVVEFWATWCKPCIAGMPHLSELAGKYRGRVIISGISILERATTKQEKIARFVDSMGRNMDYNVACDDSGYMANNWFKASGNRGIPLAFIINQEGRVAWAGLPKLMDAILPKILDGSWDITAFAARLKEQRRLAKLDNDVISTLNPLMAPGKADSAMMVINNIVAKEPGLQYYPSLGHFTIYSLMKTNQYDKAFTFAKAWLTASEEPPYHEVTDAITYITEVSRKEVTKDLYELCAACFQAQIDNYPWSMDMPKTYRTIALYWFRSGNKLKAIEAADKGIDAAKSSPGFSAADLLDMKSELEKYKAMS